MSEKEIEIEGLEKYEKLASLPEEVLRIKRRSRYDKVIADAKATPVKMTFKDRKRANSVYLALRSRIRKDKERLSVRARGLEVYVFPTKASK